MPGTSSCELCALCVFFFFYYLNINNALKKNPYCGLSEDTNELKGALGCFLLDTYYVNGEERETEGREPHGAQRRGSEGILRDPSHTILSGSHRLPSFQHDGAPMTELKYLLYLDPRYSTPVEAIMVQYLDKSDPPLTVYPIDEPLEQLDH